MSKNNDNAQTYDDDDIISCVFHSRECFKSGDIKQSLNLCIHGISLLEGKNNIELYHRAAMCAILLRDPETADKYYNQALVIDPNNENNSAILDKINELKTSLKNNPGYIHYANLEKWLLENGAIINGVTIDVSDPTNRICIATKDIKMGEIIIAIPVEFMIRSNDATTNMLAEKYFPDEVNKKLEFPQQTLKATYLAYEYSLGEKSKFNYWLDFLPSSYSTFPFFYTDKEKEIVKATNFLKILNMNKELYVRDYELLKNSIDFLGKISSEEFIRLILIAKSRAFEITMDDKKISVFVPYADLLNHNKQSNTIWKYDEEKHMFIIRACDDIKKGLEVNTTYGKTKSDTIFLLNYGFLLDENQNNEYTMFMKLTDNTYKTFNIKKRCDMDQEMFTYLRYITTDEQLIKAADASFNGFEINAEELEKYKKPTTLGHEVRMLQLLGQLMEMQDQGFETTLEQDKKYFEDHKREMTYNEYNLWYIRVMERDIIRYFKDLSVFSLEILVKRHKDDELIAIMNGSKFATYSQYLLKIVDNLHAQQN